MATAKILVVDDDPAIQNLIVRFLSHKDYQVESAECGKVALEVFDRLDPDLIILDLNLPDVNGKVLCEEMQGRTGVFVLVLTSSTDTAEKIKLLGLGADDYLTKPFDLQELECRVAAILRRLRDRTNPTKPELIFGELAICPDRREVRIGTHFINLTALEFDLLLFLAKRPGKVWRRSELIQEVWDYDYVGDQRVVDVHIGQIRKKIEFDSAQPAMIHTVRGVGYKFEIEYAHSQN
jgi:DNA-binding response OmpR family regulator